MSLHQQKRLRDALLSSVLYTLRSFSGAAARRLPFEQALHLLRTALASLRRLAALTGLPLMVVLGETEAAQAEPPTQLEPTVAMDFDGDGDLDLIDADSSGKVYGLRNQGLRFEKEELHSTDFSADAVAAVDVDGDGDKDVVVLDKQAGGLSWLENKGSENFVPHNIANLQGSVNEAFVADVTQDGRPDIVYATPGTVAWLKNDGSENFIPKTPLETDLTNISALEVEDADGDGDNDILYSDLSLAGMGQIQNNGSENFVPQVVGSQVTAVDALEVVDLDNDGNRDLVYASQSLSSVGWIPNAGEGQFLPPETLSGGHLGADHLKVADLDQDGDYDLVVASSTSNASAWLKNDGSESFTPHALG